MSKGGTIGLVALQGHIGASSLFPGAVTADEIISDIDYVLSDTRVHRLILSVNCVGASVAQSEMVHEYLAFIAQEKCVRTTAFVEDFATSGGYWAACACDEIYALKTSMIGSIGVTTRTFDISEFVERLGVRRVAYSSSEAKEDLDVFSAHDPEAIERTIFLNDKIRDVFLDSIALRRGNRLKVTLEELAMGKVYSGVTALELGLVDGISDLRTYLVKEGLDRLKFRFAKKKKKKGAGIASALLGMVTR